MNSSSAKVGIAMIVLASILWSTSGFFAKAPFFDFWSLDQRGTALAFWRAAFALVLLVPLVRRVTFRKEMIPMTLCFAAMNWTYLSALVSGPPANAIWFQNTAPVWVMLVSVFILGEKSNATDWMMLGLCAIGILLILVMELNRSADQTNARSAALGLASGLLYSGVVLSLRWLRSEDSAWLVVLNFSVTALVLAPAVLFTSPVPQGTTWLVLFGFGVFQMGLPYLLFAKGLRTTPGPLASLLTLLEPLLLPVWIFVAWRNSPGYEPPQWWTIVGGGLILSGLCVRFLPTSNRGGS